MKVELIVKKNQGQIFLHDVRESALIEAKKRFARSGMTNTQFHCGEKSLPKFVRKFDWLILDVPCSGIFKMNVGTGTIRRNPDLKWKFNEKVLDNLIKTQRGSHSLKIEIFNNAIKYVKPGGKILYSTCSLLSEENENQVEYFLKTFKLELYNNKYFQSLPQVQGMDGFFSSVLVSKGL